MDRKTNSRNGDRIPLWKKASVIGLGGATLLLTACGTNDTKADGPTTSSQPVATETAPSTTTQDITTSPSPTIESSIAPSETSSTAEQEPKTLADKYTIKASDTDPTKFGARFCEALNDWSTEGFTTESLKDPQVWNNGGDTAGSATFLIGNSDNEIIKALFVANPDQGTQNFIDDMVKRHESTIEKKIITGLGIEFGDDKEVYDRLLTCTQTVEGSDGTTTYTMSVNDKDNGDMNRIGKANGGALNENSSYTVKVEPGAGNAVQILSIKTSTTPTRQ